MAAGQSITLPAGGTWLYWLASIAGGGSAGAMMAGAGQFGIDAGGAVITAVGGGAQRIGWAWRIS